MHSRTRAAFKANDIKASDHIVVIDPVGYLDMFELESGCEMVIADSGGLQKEACSFRKPCVTPYETTGWVDLVRNGWMTLVGSDAGKLRADGERCLWEACYGDGNAGGKILDARADALG